MYCWYCGTKLAGAAAFCHGCGQSQAVDAEFDPAARPLAPTGWSWQAAAPAPDPSAESPPVGEIDANVTLPPSIIVPIRVDAATEDSPAPASRPAVARHSATGKRPSRIVGLLALLCGVAVVAGSWGPWVTAHVMLREPIQYHGSDGDGKVTFWCGLAALICVAALLVSPRRGSLGILAAGAFFLAALIGISDWSNIIDHFDELRRVSESALLRAEIGWGLRAVTFGGVAGTILAMVQAVQSRRSIA